MAHLHPSSGKRVPAGARGVCVCVCVMTCLPSSPGLLLWIVPGSLQLLPLCCFSVATVALGMGGAVTSLCHVCSVVGHGLLHGWQQQLSLIPVEGIVSVMAAYWTAPATAP